MIPGVLIRVPVVVVTLLRCGRSVEPLSSTGLGVRLGPAPYDELTIVQEVERLLLFFLKGHPTLRPLRGRQTHKGAHPAGSWT